MNYPPRSPLPPLHLSPACPTTTTSNLNMSHNNLLIFHPLPTSASHSAHADALSLPRSSEPSGAVSA